MNQDELYEIGAKAGHDARSEEHSWETEDELVKEMFRIDSRATIDAVGPLIRADERARVLEAVRRYMVWPKDSTGIRHIVLNLDLAERADQAVGGETRARRIDSEGRDVTHFPAMWDESDTLQEKTEAAQERAPAAAEVLRLSSCCKAPVDVSDDDVCTKCWRPCAHWEEKLPAAAEPPVATTHVLGSAHGGSGGLACGGCFAESVKRAAEPPVVSQGVDSVEYVSKWKPLGFGAVRVTRGPVSTINDIGGEIGCEDCGCVIKRSKWDDHVEWCKQVGQLIAGNRL